MDLKFLPTIGPSGIFGAAKPLRLSVSADSDSLSAQSTLKQTEADQTSVTGSTSGLSTLLTASNSKSFADIAAAAANSIADLRQQQVELADEARSISDPTRQSVLNTQLSALQTEIQRVYDSATFNGENVLEGKTFLVTSDTLNVNEVTSTPNLSTLTTNPNVSLTTQSSASTAYDALLGYAAAANGAAAGVEVAANKAADTLSEAVSADEAARQSDPDKISDIDSAQQTADNLAEAIVGKEDPFSTEKALVASIGQIKPERVASLLSDAE